MEPINLDRVIGRALWYIPEVILVIIAIVIILLSLSPILKKGIFYVAAAGVALNLYLLPAYITDFDYIDALDITNMMYAMRIIMAAAALITILISGRHQRMEYYLFIISILIGAEILAKVSDFVTILLSMELISLSSYVLTAGTEPDVALPKRLSGADEKKRAEAAWKFFIYGSVATAVMVFGMTYLYASTGSIRLDSEVNATSGIMFTIGSVMLLGGFLFKMTSAPFHLWAPDVYEAAPAPVVAFLSVVPKLAAFTLIASWLPRYFGNDLVIVSISILTIVIGTLAALNQSNAKRMMAYSSVAQAGFLLAIVGSRGSYETALYYALVFAIMNFVVFIVIHLQEQSGGGTAFTDFTGWGYKAPLPAVMITLGLVSLVGLPPMAGFMAKLFVFTAIWTEFSMSQNPVFLALFVVGLLATTASLYFYLKIPFYAFFRRSQEKQLIKFPVFTNLLLLILVGLLLALFLAPGLLMG